MNEKYKITKDINIMCCPICGCIFSLYEIIDNKYINCIGCKSKIMHNDIYKSKHTYNYYLKLSYKKYHNYLHWKELFINYEFCFNPLFNYNKFKNTFNIEKGTYSYCPFCGELQQKSNTICVKCKQNTSMISAKQSPVYYETKSMAIYGDFEHDEDILFDEEISLNPRYNPDLKNIKPQPVQVEKNIPKCPTCGSTNIEKISTTSKVVGAAMFGLLSKTAKSQFKCKNCGYKW